MGGGLLFYGGGLGVEGAGSGGRSDETVEDLVNMEAGFGGDGDDFVGLTAKEVDELGLDSVNVGGGEIDFVDDGDDIEVLLESEIDVGEGLSLDALGGVHDEDGGFDSLERAGDFVREVDMAGSINEVEFIALPMHLDRGELNGDALFAFKIHGIQELGLHFASGNGAGELHHAIGDGGFTMVDMGDNTKITNMVTRHRDSFV